MATKFNDDFIPNLSRSGSVIDLITGVAEDVAATARSTAPVDTGAYRDGITVVLKYQQRAVAVVVATDEKSMLIESQTGNLARALKTHARGGSRG